MNQKMNEESIRSVCIRLAQASFDGYCAQDIEDAVAEIKTLTNIDKIKNDLEIAQCANDTLERRIEDLTEQLDIEKARLDWLDKLPIIQKMEHKCVQSDGHYVTWTIKRSWEEAVTGRTIREAIDQAMRKNK